MFGMDPKTLFGEDGDAFAKQLQDAANGGQFNPLAMFAGETSLHSVFLAPLPPHVSAAIEQFMADGTGALSNILDEIKRSEPSLTQVEALQRAKDLLRHAQGFCVIVLQNDQGLAPMSHLFFGALPDAFIDALAEQCKGHNLDQAVSHALKQLQALTEKPNGNIAECFICEGIDDATEYWLELGELLCQGLDDGIFPTQQQALNDLAYWVAGGMVQSNEEFDGDELLIHARVCAQANELSAAINSLDGLLEDYEPDEDELIVVCEQLGQLAVRSGAGLELEACFEKHNESLQASLPQSYELALLRFRLLASSNVGAAQLVPAAKHLFACDAKSCRHDLNKEPVWVISKKPDDQMLDTADAADAINRSLQFIGKRLEQGTIPCYREGDELSIPARALEAWHQVMSELKLLD